MSLSSFWKDQRGSTLPMFVISLMAILSLAGAAIALSFDSRAANNLQISADEAALSGATAFLNATSPREEDRLASAKLAAESAARANADYALASLDVGAISEDPYGQKTVIQVDLKFTPVNPAARMAGRNANIAIKRSASATATWGFPLCILGLNPSNLGLSLAGVADLTAENCIVWSNATGSRSMEFEGGTAKTRHFCAAGRASIGSATVSPQPHEDCEPIPDPLASWTAPEPDSTISMPFPASSKNKSYDLLELLKALLKALEDPEIQDAGKDLKAALKGDELLPDAAVSLVAGSVDSALAMIDSGGSLTGKDIDAGGYFTSGPAAGLHLLEVAQILGVIDNLPDDLYTADIYQQAPGFILAPGTYAGLDIAAGHVKLQPGVYHIVGGPLTVRRRATLSGDGVTIVLHGEGATFSVLDEARATLTAPADGDTAGFTIAENRHAPLNGTKLERSRLTGAGKVEMIGTIYVPRQTFSITGSGAADQASPLLQLVADRIQIDEQGGLRIKFDPARTDVPMTIMPSREARLTH